MADVDINPFGEHDRTESRPDENIPLPPVTPVERGSTWEPERNQETSFRGESRAGVLYKEYLVGEIYEVIKHIKDWNLIWACSNLMKMVDYITEGNL